MTVRDLYNEFCDDVFEPQQLRLGVVTDEQFLSVLNTVLVDFSKDCCPYVDLYTQQVLQAQSAYPIPDKLMRADDAFLAGVYVEQTNTQALSNAIPNWRNEQGLPRLWHGDQLPPKTMELAPIPDYSGVPLPTDNWGSFDVAGLSPDQHQGLCQSGPVMPQLVQSLDDPVPEPFDDDVFMAYILSGVEARLFSSDNECKDMGKASFAATLYREGIEVLRAISAEAEVDF